MKNEKKKGKLSSYLQMYFLILYKMYRVFFEKSVIKFLEKHKSQNIFIQFRNALTILQENPFDGKLDIKKLK